MVDGGYDEVANGGIVLYLLVCLSVHSVLEQHTRPPLCSTHMAPLRLSVQSWPATTGVIVLGGICRSPGPSFIVPLLGRSSESMESPGNT